MGYAIAAQARLSVPLLAGLRLRMRRVTIHVTRIAERERGLKAMKREETASLSLVVLVVLVVPLYVLALDDNVNLAL